MISEKLYAMLSVCVFADDLKIHKEIESEKDTQIMQENLDRLSSYVKENRLSLNIKKCVASSFTRRTANFIFRPYHIDGITIDRKESMRDLGVIYDSKLPFNQHVDTICGKARRMLGFVMRVGKFFSDPFTFTMLYNSLVRSNVEYASVICNPHTASQKLAIERVLATNVSTPASKMN